MILSQEGKIADDFYVLGDAGMPCFMLSAEKPVLFDGGVTAMGRPYELAIRRILEGRDPSYMMVTHSHFDHCGAVAHLKGAFPDMQVGAAVRAAEVWKRPRAVELISGLNQMAAQHYVDRVPAADGEEGFASFEVDIHLQGGEVLEVGSGLEVRVISTPGHTWDTVSFYVPARKLLICSEAMGIADQSGYIFTEFLVDYDAYQESMQALAELDVEILCQGHGLIYIGRDEVAARREKAMRSAKEFKQTVEELLDKESGDQKKVMELIKQMEYDPVPGPKQPEPAYLLNLEAKVRHIAQRMAA